MTTVCIPDVDQRRDLAAFVGRARRLDESAVIRLRTRGDGLVGAWVVTGFDVLAARVVVGSVRPADFTCGADQLYRGLTESLADPATADTPNLVEAGYPMDSAWRALLPPETGFVHVDDVPAGVLAELARRGAELAREHSGPAGPPAGLLDQEVLQVGSGADDVAVPMRCVLALAAMGFAPESGTDVVRVRSMPNWLRIDARFGSVFRRRGDPALLIG